MSFTSTAEFHELGMVRPWDALLPRLEQAVQQGLGGPPARVLEVGAGSGMGTLRLARLWPEAEVLAIEPDRAMRSMLMAHLTADASLRRRLTVLTLPIASGTVTQLSAQIGDPVDLIVMAHMAQILEPDELRALFRLCAAVLAPGGMAVVTWSAPHSEDGVDQGGEHRHEEWVDVGGHRVRGVYERSEQRFQVRYEQVDAAGQVLRATTRVAPARELAGAEALAQAAQASGLQASDLGWEGVTVLTRAARETPTTSPAVSPTTVDWAEICQAHTARLQARDPWVGAVPEPAAESADVLTATQSGDGGDLYGVLRQVRHSTQDPVALWGPSVQEVVQIRSAVEPEPEALASLLRRWLLRLESEGETGSGDRGAVVRLPVAETAASLPLLEAGFVPQTTTAVRTVVPARDAAPESQPRSGVTVRPPVERDRDRLLELATEMVQSDIGYGSAWDRPTLLLLVAHYVDEMLALPRGWASVAEQDGEVAGLLSLNPPDASSWAAPSTSLAPVVYLGMAAVAQRHRGAGIGRMLVAAAHRQAARSGAAAVLLDTHRSARCPRPSGTARGTGRSGPPGCAVFSRFGIPRRAGLAPSPRRPHLRCRRRRAVPVSFGWRHWPWSTAPRSRVPGVTLTPVRAGMVRASPVCGLRPVRAARSTVLIARKPGIVTSSPRATELTTASSSAVRKRSASAAEVSSEVARAVQRSLRFMCAPS